MDQRSGTDTHIAVDGLCKHYGGVAALVDVDLTVRRGEIHALVGENGAGKSTLGKIIAGAVEPDAGAVRINGREVRYRSPRDAIRDGISIIDQELALVPTLSVLDNVFLGIEHGAYGALRRSTQRRRFAELARRIEFGVDPSTRVGGLRTAEQQKVEILRALARDASLIVMDEPTAALMRSEADRLHEIAAELRAEGVTVIYVSHFLEEVLALCDTITVLKDGRLVETVAAAEEDVDSLVTSMLGRSLELSFPDSQAPPPDAPIVLAARGLSRPPDFADVTLEVRAGEIVGLAGLVGSGRTEIARALFGADSAEGEISIEGRPLDPVSPTRAIKCGIAMLPESRKEQGLVMSRSIRDNVALAHLDEVTSRGFVRRRHQRELVGEVLARVGARAPNTALPVAALSGGNQQKAALAKWLLRPPRVLLADEPTRGIDVGSKRAIYELIGALAAEGIAVLMISSELEELLGLAHRIVVVREGRIVADLPRAEADEESVMRAAFGAVAADLVSASATPNQGEAP